MAHRHKRLTRLSDVAGRDASGHLRALVYTEDEEEHCEVCDDDVHGILGQGFDPRRNIRDGKVDVYPTAGNYTTQAMAEGSIEGDTSEYEVADSYAARFKYSRYLDPGRATNSYEDHGVISCR